jgi:hypothetical protein
MPPSRPIHPDFVELLQRKDPALVELFTDLRSFILELHPTANELLYHTHALTAVFSMSEKLGDAYCMLPIYAKHVNLGFNKGTRLPDPHKLLTGTGNLIRHIPVQGAADYRNPKVKALVKAAMKFAKEDMDTPPPAIGRTISKIATRQ